MKNVGIPRRDFLKRAARVLALLGLSGVIADSFLFATKRFRVEEVVVRIKGLPSAFQGLKICQITDLHHSKYVSMDFIEEASKEAAALKPDMYVFTGDFISEDKKYAAPVLDLLAALDSDLGSFAVLGNHDYWVDGAYVAKEIKMRGIRLLDNASAIVRRGADKICIAGVDDLWEGRPSTRAAFEGVPKNMTRVLLSHHPDLAEVLLGGERVDLVISGHTHGGQIRLPFGYAPVTNSKFGQKYTGGLVRTNQTQVYVSRGLGTVILPVRFNSPPEITLLRLVKA